MRPTLPSPLPPFDRTLLRAVKAFVPAGEREEWGRTWQAELWHMRHRSGRSRRGQLLGIQTLAMTADLSIGLTRDALWLRTESWRRAYGGTASLCLGSLVGLCGLSMLILLALAGSWHAARPQLGGEFRRFLMAAPLVIFVSFATASRRHIEQTATGRAIDRIKRQLFLVTKTSLMLLLCFLLSVDVCQPVHGAFPNTTDVVQVFLFVILALIGMRWAVRDQEQRCEQCLRALASPARVGRPSHNLLEWNGTEQICTAGHGLLSVPEMESSWRESSRWVTAGWDGAASV